MKPAKLFTLLLIAAAVCVGAILAYRQQNQSQRPAFLAKAALEVGSPLLPKLPEAAASIAQVSFAQAATSITLVRSGDPGWSIQSIGGYPANASKINQLVLELTDLKVADVLSDSKDRYPNFGVADGKAERGTVRLADKTGKEIAVLHLGTERSQPENSEPSLARGGGRHVRVDSDPGVYMVDENLYWLDTKPSTWADTEIVSLPADKVVAVAVDHGTTESFKLVEVQGALKLDTVEQGMQEKTSEIGTVSGGLANLRFDNVMRADSPVARSLDFASSYTAHSKDGTVYRTQIAKEGEKYFLKIRAQAEAPVFTAADNASTVTLAAAKKEAEAARKAVPDFNELHGKWVYEVQEWTAKNLLKNRSELNEKPAPPSATPAAAPADSAMPAETDAASGSPDAIVPERENPAPPQIDITGPGRRPGRPAAGQAVKSSE